MEILHVTHPLDEGLVQEPSVMALGFFDGVHLGHQRLFQKAKELARDSQLPFTVMTFDPHPSEVIGHKTGRGYLTPLPDKLERISSFGADKVYVVNFNLLFASLPPSEFIRHYLVSLQVKHVVVGFDFRFGCKAAGDAEFLKKFSGGFDVTIIPKVTNDEHKISSTFIRNLISDGDVHLVPHYLGKHYEISGSVMFRSHQSSYFHMENNYLSPKLGLYQVEVTNGFKTCLGMLKCCNETPNRFELLDVHQGVLEGGECGGITIKFLYRALDMRGASALA
ncbi:hypothetical protein [Neobacillus niacini]|uniref:hypothetical protein n=1 Tax=Neobacillus niacini TaxID=86668 RepID=UPI0021CB7EEF|nr:hypothetical protein [Neobacillus niacini]MCM3766360.1 hypothetical protein [Neobacillus niacini]